MCGFAVQDCDLQTCLVIAPLNPLMHLWFSQLKTFRKVGEEDQRWKRMPGTRKRERNTYHASSLKPDDDKSDDMSQWRIVGKGVFGSSMVMVTRPSEASISPGSGHWSFRLEIGFWLQWHRIMMDLIPDSADFVLHDWFWSVLQWVFGLFYETRSGRQIAELGKVLWEIFGW